MVNKKGVGAVIQARYDSSRLPGKVLMELPFHGGKTILEHIVDRLKLVNKVEKIIIATSDQANDAPVVREAERLGVQLFRGSKNNVLDRFYQAAREFELHHVIRLTGDNPVVLTEIMEEGIASHLGGGYDYTRNEGLPYGTSFEIVAVDALTRIISSNPSKDESEHVTLFIKRNRSEFKILEKQFPQEDTSKKMRLTIDYASDYALMNILMQILREKDYVYSREDLFEIFEKKPWLLAINKDNAQRKQYQNFEEEYPEALKIMEKFGLKHSIQKLKNKVHSKKRDLK